MALRHQASGGFVGEAFELLPHVEEALPLTEEDAHRIIGLLACERDAFETYSPAIVT